MGAGTVAVGAACPPAPGHTARFLPSTAPVGRDPSLGGSVIPSTPGTLVGAAPSSQNFLEQLKSSLLGKVVTAARPLLPGPSPCETLLRSQPGWMGIGTTRTPAPRSTPSPCLNELSFPAAPPGITAHPSAREWPTAGTEGPLMAPAPTSRCPGPQPLRAHAPRPACPVVPLP